MTAGYKVLDAGQSSYHGGSGKWVRNRWRTVQGELEPCRNGIHYCRADQLVCWLGPTIWRFEDGSPDETVDHHDKMVTRKGRVVERLATWNEMTARLFAADCAEMVLPIFERRCPGDDRPRRAIEAARLFARGEIDAAAEAAAEAAAGAAAWAAAWDAAWDAAWAHQTVLLFDYLEGRRP